ncbi:hypothetical protein L7F22_055661 [Adiantum nelumboides]|nr:hypothetical protein [Adiantum nelumboides]
MPYFEHLEQGRLWIDMLLLRQYWLLHIKRGVSRVGGPRASAGVLFEGGAVAPQPAREPKSKTGYVLGWAICCLRGPWELSWPSTKTDLWEGQGRLPCSVERNPQRMHGSVAMAHLVPVLENKVCRTCCGGRVHFVPVLFGEGSLQDLLWWHPAHCSSLMVLLQHDNTDSGHYGVPGNSKEHRARLLAGECILQRFEENQDTLQVLNAMQLQFRILSMTTPNQWYQVNFQSNYFDCPDWSSECKHLYGMKLIVKHHFPEMATILLVLDNAHQTLATHDNKIVTEEKDEKVKTCIHELKELFLSLEQEIPNKRLKDMEIMLHQLRLSKDMLGALLSPSQIDMPACGSNVVDTSGGCGASFLVEVVSSAFEGTRLLERHRLVNAALAEEMKQIHALSLKKALTPQQWQEEHATKTASSK